MLKQAPKDNGKLRRIIQMSTNSYPVSSKQDFYALMSSRQALEVE